jgi:hypothetical protein
MSPPSALCISTALLYASHLKRNNVSQDEAEIEAVFSCGIGVTIYKP